MTLPYAPQGELTLAIARDPYRTVSRNAERLGADVFQGKLLLSDCIFLTGPGAAEAFYTSGLARRNAAPGILVKTLFGSGGVQTLDEAEHSRRKALFMTLLGGDAPDRLAAMAARQLDELAASCPDSLSVQYKMERVLTRVACDFAGVPLKDADLDRRARMLADLFLHAAPFRPAFVKGVTSRRQADAWAGDLISDTRAGKLTPPRGSALDEIASYRTAEGAPLSRQVAAVELLNILRPIVAVSSYLTFCAHAVATQENARQDAMERPASFIQEVRRHYPFFPLLAAKTTDETQIMGHTIAAGTRVILDVYGTNHDSRLWEDPMMFRPKRFDDRQIGPFDLIPQGGGDREDGHRCPGEAITVAIMRTFTDWLGRIDYTRPKQDLELDMSKLPALPYSHMIWQDLRPRQTP